MVTKKRKAKYVRVNTLVKVGEKSGRGEYRRVRQFILDLERVRGIDIYKVYLVFRNYGHGLLMQEYKPDQFLSIKVHPSTKLDSKSRNNRIKRIFKQARRI